MATGWFVEINHFLGIDRVTQGYFDGHGRFFSIVAKPVAPTGLRGFITQVRLSASGLEDRFK